MTFQTRWIKVNQDKYDQEPTESSNGLAFQVFMSPYDIPEAIRGGYDPARKQFYIAIKYIGDEKTQRIQQQQHVVFEVGQNSGRLYGIEIDVDALNIDEVILRVERAIDELTRRPPSQHAPANNYEVTKTVLADNRGRLFRDLAAAR